MLQVLPSWQKGGIGRGLMERLITELLHDGISAITLYAEPKVRCRSLQLRAQLHAWLCLMHGRLRCDLSWRHAVA